MFDVRSAFLTASQYSEEDVLRATVTACGNAYNDAQRELETATSELVSTFNNLSTQLHAALARVETATRKRRQVESDIEASASRFVENIDVHADIVARSTKRAKLRSINRPIESVQRHPLLFGLVNGAKGVINVSNKELDELREKENDDNEQVEEARKTVDKYNRIRHMFTSQCNGGQESDVRRTELLNATVDALEWTTAFAVKLAESN